MGTKSETLRDADKGLGCLGKAHDNEPVFVLRAQDVLAPIVVRIWADMLVSLRNDITASARQKEKALQALAVSEQMTAWQDAHRVKMPD